MSSNSSKPIHRTCTTVIGFLILGIALLGVFFAGLQLISIVVLDFSQKLPAQASKLQLYTPCLMSLVPNIALLATAIFILLRQRWAYSYFGIAVTLAIISNIWQWRVRIPQQLQNVFSEPERLGIYTGSYMFSFFVGVMYIGLFFFLFSRGTRAELAGKKGRK